jgi:hypothetical protein
MPKRKHLKLHGSYLWQNLLLELIASWIPPNPNIIVTIISKHMQGLKFNDLNVNYKYS